MVLAGAWFHSVPLAIVLRFGHTTTRQEQLSELRLREQTSDPHAADRLGDYLATEGAYLMFARPVAEAASDYVIELGAKAVYRGVCYATFD